MNFERLIFIPFLVATGLAPTVVMLASGEESQPRREPAIQSSDVRCDVVSSNVNQLKANKTTLRSLEQSIKKPFEWPSLGDSLADRFTAAPVWRAPPSIGEVRQMKELLEKRNEWVFLSPEDYFAAGLTAEEILNLPEYGPNGEQKKKKTALERYYERLDRESAKSQVGSDVLTRRKMGERQEGLKELLLGGQPNSWSFGLSDLKQTVEHESSGVSSAFDTVVSDKAETRGFSDLFGFGKAEPAPEKSRAMEARMQEFRQLLETRSLTTANPGVGTLNPLSSSSLAAPLTGPSTGIAVPGSDNGRGALTPLAPGSVSQTSLPGLASPPASFGSPSWQTPPAPETPQMTLPPPTFNIPKRKF